MGGSALGGARTMNHVYDSGDNWQHRIKVEKTLDPAPAGTFPLCVAGVNATPPDDCGDVYGYYDFVAAISDISAVVRVTLIASRARTASANKYA